VHALAFQVFAQHVAGLLVFVEHGDARIVGAARACSYPLAGAAIIASLRAKRRAPG
jgi:hypothetical protein